MEPFEFMKQNADEMNTVVETYFVEEVSDMIHDNEKLSKWHDMVCELGLEGQKNVVRGSNSPIPFLIMNEQAKDVFKTLCPSAVDIKEYNQMPIPTEILDLVGLSLKEDYFGKIEIWYDEKQKDPVCIGCEASYWVDDEKGQKIEKHGKFANKNACLQYIKDNELIGCKPYDYAYQRKMWLIGRWADVKQSFNDLRIRAKDRFVSTGTNELTKQIKDLQRKLEDIQLDADLKFGTI